MKKFVFTLESVLKAKEVLDRQKVQELSIIIDKKNKVLVELAYLEERRQHLCTLFNNKTEHGISVDNVRVHYHYLSKLRDSIGDKEKTLAQLKKDEADIRLQLMEIRRDKKMLETLKEKKYQEYLLEVKAEEERLIDELVSYKETIRSLQEG